MRPKARGLAHHGDPPGWLEESDPAGVICTWWTGCTACLFLYRTGCPDRSCPAASWWNSSCCYVVNVHNNPPWATSRKDGIAWYSSIPMPSLWLRTRWMIASWYLAWPAGRKKCVIYIFSAKVCKKLAFSRWWELHSIKEWWENFVVVLVYVSFQGQLRGKPVW
jgi:hypothetical protein